MADACRDINEDPIFITDGSGNGNLAAINADGALKVDWTDCPLTEESMKALAREEAKEVLRLKTKELKEELDEESPIRRLRRKVTDWLNS